jgi:hypothetical protein
VILFVYGTLLDPAVLARVSGEAALVRRLRPARLRPPTVRRPGRCSDHR